MSMINEMPNLNPIKETSAENSFHSKNLQLNFMTVEFERIVKFSLG